MEWWKKNPGSSLAGMGVLITTLGVAIIAYSEFRYCLMRSTGSVHSCPEIPATLFYLAITATSAGLVLLFFGWVLAFSDECMQEQHEEKDD